MKTRFLCALGLLWVWMNLWALPSATMAADKNLAEPGQELSEKECIDMAFKNNSLIKEAASKEAVAQAKVYFEKSKYFPKLSFLEHPGYANRNLFFIEGVPVGNALDRRELSAKPRLFNEFETRLVLPILGDGVFGFGSHKIARANYAVEQSHYVLNAAKRDVVSQVKDLFLLAQKAQIEKDLYQEAVTNHQNILRLVKEKFARNLAAQKDVLLAEARLAQAQTDLAMAENAYHRELKSLFLLIGASPASRLRIAWAPDLLPSLPPWQEVVGKIPTNNLDLMAKKLNINIAQEELALSKNKLWPTLELSARYFGTVSENTSFTNTWASYFTIYFPIFDYTIYKDVGVKREEVRYASENYRVSTEKVIQTAIDQYKELQDIRPQMSSTQKQINFLTENLREGMEKYRQNLISFLDLANAQYLLNNAKKNLKELYFKYQSGYRKLQNLIGMETIFEEKSSLGTPSSGHSLPPPEQISSLSSRPASPGT